MTDGENLKRIVRELQEDKDKVVEQVKAAIAKVNQSRKELRAEPYHPRIDGL